MQTLETTIGFIGAGNMAEAIIGALIGSKTVDATHVSACDINEDHLSTLKRSYNIKTTPDAGRLFEESDIVILSVKPQVMDTVLAALASLSSYGISKRKLVISIAAGITLDRLEKILYAPLDDEARAMMPLIRVMPNTPSLVLTGMAGFCMNAMGDPNDARITQVIFEAMGKAVSVSEAQMDAVTAVSGSGPAYFFYMVEAMVDKAVDMGLSPDDALTLAVQTMKGAACLLEDSGESPEQLRKKVTSPGGTTEAALKSLEASGYKTMVGEALEQAARRSKELSG